MESTAAAQPLSPADDVPDAVRDDEAAVAALAQGHDKPGDNQPQIRANFEVVHNVKGQGGSFGYDLLMKIGG